MKIIIVAGGPSDHLPSMEIYKSDSSVIWVGVDRGASYLIRNEVHPHHLFGDFDSIESEHQAYILSHENTHHYDPEKNETDLELALLWAVSERPEEIIVLGATGGRMDHALANLYLLAKFPGVTIKIIDRQNEMFLLQPGRHEIKENPNYTYISFVAYSDVVKELTLRGLKYELDHYTLQRDTSRCISNEFIESKCTISFCEGILLLIKSKEL